jgi:hypothetical protein
VGESTEGGAPKAGFSGLTDKVLTLAASDIVGKDVELRDLTRCRVFIRGQPVTALGVREIEKPLLPCSISNTKVWTPARVFFRATR